MAFHTSEFAHCYVDDTGNGPSPNFLICWRIHACKDSVNFGIGAVTEVRKGVEQYFGFGITEGGMYGADITIYSRSLGLQDRYSKEEARPILDPPDQQVCGFYARYISFLVFLHLVFES